MPDVPRALTGIPGVVELASATITADDAAAVCWHFGLPGGRRGNEFTTALIGLLATADTLNRAKLAAAYPGLAAALHLANGPLSAVARLRTIAGG